MTTYYVDARFTALDALERHREGDVIEVRPGFYWGRDWLFNVRGKPGLTIVNNSPEPVDLDGRWVDHCFSFAECHGLRVVGHFRPHGDRGAPFWVHNCDGHYFRGVHAYCDAPPDWATMRRSGTKMIYGRQNQHGIDRHGAGGGVIEECSFHGYGRKAEQRHHMANAVTRDCIMRLDAYPDKTDRNEELAPGSYWGGNRGAVMNYDTRDSLVERTWMLAGPPRHDPQEWEPDWRWGTNLYAHDHFNHVSAWEEQRDARDPRPMHWLGNRCSHCAFYIADDAEDPNPRYARVIRVNATGEAPGYANVIEYPFIRFPNAPHVWRSWMLDDAGNGPLETRSVIRHPSYVGFAGARDYGNWRVELDPGQTRKPPRIGAEVWARFAEATRLSDWGEHTAGDLADEFE